MWFRGSISLILNPFLRVFSISGFLKVIYARVGIGYPKFGYPRVIPGPEPNFGYGLGWVCVSEFHGYFRVGYP